MNIWNPGSGVHGNGLLYLSATYFVEANDFTRVIKMLPRINTGFFSRDVWMVYATKPNYVSGSEFLPHWKVLDKNVYGVLNEETGVWKWENAIGSVTEKPGEVVLPVSYASPYGQEDFFILEPHDSVWERDPGDGKWKAIPARSDVVLLSVCGPVQRVSTLEDERGITVGEDVSDDDFNFPWLPKFEEGDDVDDWNRDVLLPANIFNSPEHHGF